MAENSSHTGIVYFSRSGHSKRLAERLSHELTAELVEITAPAYTPNWWGYARAGYDSLRQRRGSEFACPPLAEFSRIILCGPVWTSYPAVPLRQFLRSEMARTGDFSLFLTSGAHSPPQKAFSAGEADLGRTFSALAALPNSAEDTAQEERTITRFLTDLSQAKMATPPD